MGGFQWHAISRSSNWTASLSGFGRAVTAQIKKLLLSLPSSSLKAMARVKLPPAGSQLILGLIPVVLGICSTLVSEERQIHGADREPTRPEQMK